MFFVLYKEISKPNKTEKYHYNEVIHVPIDHLDEILKKFILGHKVILFLFLNIILYDITYII